MVSFFAVKRGSIPTFERRENGFREITAVIIRLIGPAILQAAKLIGYTS